MGHKKRVNDMPRLKARNVTEEERGRNGGVEIVNLPPMFLSNPPPKFPFIPKFRWKKMKVLKRSLPKSIVL